jgi:hypothetical protein
MFFPFGSWSSFLTAPCLGVLIFFFSTSHHLQRQHHQHLTTMSTDPIGEHADANANANDDTRPYVSQQSSASSSGLALSKDPIRHNGVSTPIELRRGLGIRGLVPSAYISLDLDVERCMEQIAAKKGRPIDQYSYLQSIQDVSERLYFAILTKHTATVMPIVYTPIVGEGKYPIMHCENNMLCVSL